MTDSNTANNDNNATRVMTDAELDAMENKLREDFAAGEIDTDTVWDLIQQHASDLAQGCAFKPSRAVALMAVLLHKMPVSLDQLIEHNPDSREKLETTQTAFKMLEDSLYARYNVSEILKEEEHLEFAKQSFYEMNAFMAVTTCFQDMCYFAAVVNYVAQQLVLNWASFLEDGFTADKAKGLKIWKEIAAAAELANSTI